MNVNGVVPWRPGGFIRGSLTASLRWLRRRTVWLYNSVSFRSAIAFDDHYDSSLCAATSHPIRIWDPVNHENNAAKFYTAEQRDAIIQAALEAGDAIDAALRAPTKGETLRYWRKIFGPTFDA
jgi:hypothetical protein